MPQWSIGTFSLVILAGLSTGSPGVSSVWWSPELGISGPEQAKEALNEAVSLADAEALTLHNAGQERSITTCNGYLDAKAEGFGSTNNFEYAKEGTFVERCYVLRTLQSVRPARQSFLGGEEWTQSMAEALPVLLYNGFPNTQADAARSEQRSGETWAGFDRQLRFDSTSGLSLSAHDNGTTYQLKIVARGDFNGDGIEDLALVGFANARQATFRYFQFLIVSRLKPDGLFTVLTDEDPPFDLKSSVAAGGS